MKYFIVKANNESRHLIAAKDVNCLNKLIEENFEALEILELTETTFDKQGFIMAEEKTLCY